MKQSLKISKILLVSTTALGDTLLATPSIRAVAESYPYATLDMIVNSKVYDLISSNPFITNLYTYRNNIFYRLILFFKLFLKRYDYIFILHANIDILGLLTRLNFGKILNCQTFKDEKKSLELINIPYNIHAAERRLKLVGQIGAKSSVKSLEIFLKEEDISFAERFIKKHFKNKNILIGLQPGAAKPYKCWPTENFAKVASYLNSKYNANIIITGIKKELNLFYDIKKLSGIKDIVFTGGLSIMESSAIIKRCDLFITNDTGPMHIAFALGTKTIALFCPSDGVTIGPYNCISKKIVINKKPACDPCITKRCADPFCMKDITVEEVLEASWKLLNCKSTAESTWKDKVL